MRESELERKVVKHAKSMGVLSFKFVSPSQRGVPDRIFIGPGGVLFMELKVGHNKPTELQQYHIEQINQHGGKAVWCSNLDDALIEIKTNCL